MVMLSIILPCSSNINRCDVSGVTPVCWLCCVCCREQADVKSFVLESQGLWELVSQIFQSHIYIFFYLPSNSDSCIKMERFYRFPILTPPKSLSTLAALVLYCSSHTYS